MCFRAQTAVSMSAAGFRAKKKHALTLTVPADQGTCFSPRYQLQSSEVMQTIPLATEVYSGTLYACEGMPMQKGATWTCGNTSALSSRP